MLLPQCPRDRAQRAFRALLRRMHPCASAGKPPIEIDDRLTALRSDPHQVGGFSARATAKTRTDGIQHNRRHARPAVVESCVRLADARPTTGTRRALASMTE